MAVVPNPVRACAALVVLLAALLFTATGSDAEPAHPRAAHHPKPIFGPSSVWRQRVDGPERLEALSPLYVKRLEAAAARGAWINTTGYSTPVYRVPGNQRRVRVTLDQAPGVHSELRRAIARVPIPAGARPAEGTDGNLVVWQPSTGTMWEFWGARRAADGWHARFGGRMSHLRSGPGYFPRDPGWGATATGLPLLGGLIRLAELRAGRIDHAVSMAVPDTRAGLYAWPAQRTDGTSNHPLSLPEGSRLRLNPRLDLDRLQLPRIVRLIAEAAQRYGIIVTDRGENIAFYGEDPTPYRRNPYWPGRREHFSGESPDRLLAAFPWSQLQLLDAKRHLDR
jgi:hypothetical protein